MSSKQSPAKVYVSKTVDVEAHAEIDVIAELKHMDGADVLALHRACAERLKLTVEDDSDALEVGIDLDRGRRELARVVNQAWTGLSHHAQFVARQIGV